MRKFKKIPYAENFENLNEKLPRPFSPHIRTELYYNHFIIQRLWTETSVIKKLLYITISPYSLRIMIEH